MATAGNVGYVSLKIDSIEIEGNIKTKRSVILRELSFSQGSTYSYHNFPVYHIPRSVANLKNIDLFNDIVIDLIEHDARSNSSNSKHGKVVIKLLEKNYLWPLPFVEFADRNLNQWYLLDLQPYRTNFGLYLFKNNVWGLNHTAKLTFGFGYTNTLAFQYIAPYIDKKKKLGFEIDIRQRSNREIQYDISDNRELFYRDTSKTLIKTRWIKTQWRYRPKLYFTHLLELNTEQVHVDQSVLQTLNPEFMLNDDGKQQLYSARYGVEYNHVDNTFFPLKGVSYRVMLGGHSLDNTLQYASVESGLSVFGQVPFVFNRLYAGISGYASHKTTNRLPFNQNKSLGYDHYIRGYENNVFLSPTFGYFKYELRYLIINDKNFFLRYMPLKAYKSMPTTSYISAFIDDGGTPDNRLTGYGIGINTVFYYDKVFRFEYSWNKDGQSGLKIHLEKAF